MRITTNYSKSDWKRAVPEILISLTPIMIFSFLVLNFYIPYLENWTTFLNFETDNETIAQFLNYVISNEQLQTGWLTPDGWFFFFFIMLFGSAIFPLILCVIIYSRFPKDYIIKKLGLESRMKLVVFINGKPITRIRDLF